MTREQVFRAWAPDDSVWSPWVAPAIFAELNCDQLAPFTPSRIDWAEDMKGDAVVLDLEGKYSVIYGVEFAELGYRPVPVFNATVGPIEISNLGLTTPATAGFSTVDLNPVADNLCMAASLLGARALPPNAPPVFLLEYYRLLGHRSPKEEMFDNRWVVFPQDFPSAQFLLSQGLKQVTLVQHHEMEPQSDLAHVLLRWQEAGIQIFAKQLIRPRERVPIKVTKPSSFKAAWYRALTILGLRRSSVGGFGSYIPEESSGSGFA